ncbi:MAG: MarR family transcriptional regulator [Actinomycetaceae bacterium]|nr:MarR family transcriptional regulator [Actinomycetaceae bacterium]
MVDPSQTRHDEVDRIIDAWHAQRPDVDTSPMEIFSRITRIDRILSLKRRRAFAEHNLEEWEFDVLSSLRRCGDKPALTPGALMSELLVSSGTMTNRINRLEAKDLVRRQPDPSDKRGVLVVLTPDGRTCVDAAIQSLVVCEKQMLNDFSQTDLRVLRTHLRNLLMSLEEKPTLS